MPERYLRAITDKNEKKEISTLFRSKTVTLVIGAVLALATLVVGAIAASAAERGAFTAFFYVLLVLTCLDLFLHFAVRSVISSKMSLILKRPLREGEGKELLDYRKKLYEEMKADKAAFRKNVIPAVAGAVVFVALLIAETFIYPGLTAFGAIAMTGFALLIVGVAVTVALCAVYDRRMEKSRKDDEDGASQGTQT